MTDVDDLSFLDDLDMEMLPAKPPKPEPRMTKAPKGAAARVEEPSGQDEPPEKGQPDLPEFDIGKDVLRELARHSAVYANWALWLVDLQAKKAKLQARLDIMEASAREEAREGLRAVLGKTSVTETAVKDVVMKDGRIRSLYVKIDIIEKDERLARAVINSLDVKTKMLQSLAGLKRSEIETLSNDEM